MGDLMHQISSEELEELENLRAFKAKMSSIGKLHMEEVDLLTGIRNGTKIVITKEQAILADSLHERFNNVTDDEIQLLMRIRAGEMIVFGADEMVSASDPLQGDDPFTNYQIDQTAWSLNTFGPGARTAGILDHIRKELAEIEKTPYDLTEWIDVVILAMDGYWRHGGNVRMALELLKRKQQKNFARQWPDWRTMSEDQAIEHDRTGE